MAMEYVMLVAVLFVLALLVMIYFYLIGTMGKDPGNRRRPRRRRPPPEPSSGKSDVSEEREADRSR